MIYRKISKKWKKKKIDNPEPAKKPKIVKKEQVKVEEKVIQKIIEKHCVIN